MTDTARLGTLAGALADVTRWMTEESIAGVVIGGVAASLLGRPRLTRDVDAWPSATRSAGNGSEFAAVLDTPEVHDDFEQMLRQRRRR